MAKISLKEAAELSGKLNPDELRSNPDMLEYVEEMQVVGNDVMKNLSTEELAVVVSFMQAMFSYSLLQNNPIMAMRFLSATDDTSLAMAQALQFAIGVVLSEEWR